MSSGNTRDDTFLGAYAPAGRYITGASWFSSSGDFSGLDDLAFITSTSNVALSMIVVDADPVMEPSSAESRDSSDSPNYGEWTLFGRAKHSC